MFAARSLKSFHIIFNGSVTDDNFGAFQYCPILAAVASSDKYWAKEPGGTDYRLINIG